MVNPSDGIHPLIIWGLVLFSIVLIAGITYVYTNRNKRITLLFTLISALAIAAIKLIGTVEIELKSQFIGRFSEANVPYIVANPGWYQILYAWHIWILPVVFVTVIFGGLIILIWRLKSEANKTEVLPTATSPIKAGYHSTTRAERLSTFMAMDAARKEAQLMNEKLAEALLMNAAYEIKVSDMNLQLHDLEKSHEELKRTSQEEITTLQLELSAKQKENDYIAEQLSERSRDLVRAQEMFEKLLAMQKQDNS
jgi:hypothetical protein